MMEASARTGYVDLILAIFGLAALYYNIEVALVLLSLAFLEYVANRAYLLVRIFSGTTPTSSPHGKTPKRH